MKIALLFLLLIACADQPAQQPPTPPERVILREANGRLMNRTVPCIWAGRRMKPEVCEPRRWWDSVARACQAGSATTTALCP